MATQVTLDIFTQSEVIHYKKFPWPDGKAPFITINGIPVDPPGLLTLPTGYQLLIFDSSKPLLDPSSLILNEYFYVEPLGNTNLWSQTYGSMYQLICHELQQAEPVENQVRVLASFGLDRNMVPTSAAFAEMSASGAGSRLQHWENTCNPGSEAGMPGSWVTYPASYILVGGNGWGPGQGFEVYEFSSQRARLTVSVPSV
jgi:hypothetical protein